MVENFGKLTVSMYVFAYMHIQYKLFLYLSYLKLYVEIDKIRIESNESTEGEQIAVGPQFIYVCI